MPNFISFKSVLWFGTPSIINVAIRLVSLPITTFYLGPKEFGEFAVVLGFVALFLAVASSFSSQVVSHQYRQAGDLESESAVFTCVVVEMALAVAGAIALVLLWPIFGQLAGLGQPIPSGCIFLAAVAIPITTLWQSVVQVVIFEGKARTFALASSLSSVIQVVSTTLALHLGLGLSSLFIGYSAGAAVTAIFALPTVLHLRHAGISLKILGELRDTACLAVGSNLAEASLASLERVGLSRFTSLEMLGIYYHSVNYRHILLSLTKSVALAGHRRTIDEARTESTDFSWTRQAWTKMYGVLMLAGVGAAFIGAEIVSILTHDKFTTAASLIPLWCITLIIQQIARPHQYKMMAHGEANRLSFYKLSSIALGIGSLVITIPLTGVYGPILSLFFKEGIHRGLVYFHGYARWRIPFSDRMGVIAGAVILASMLAASLLAGEFMARLSIWLILTTILMVYLFLSDRVVSRPSYGEVLVEK